MQYFPSSEGRKENSHATIGHSVVPGFSIMLSELPGVGLAFPFGVSMTYRLSWHDV